MTDAQLFQIANTTALLDTVDQALLYGRMPAGLRSVIAAQVDAQGSDATARVGQRSIVSPSLDASIAPSSLTVQQPSATATVPRTG